jgi:hypothetical protein
MIPVDRRGILGHAQDALDAADYTAGDAPNGTTNSRTHGTCCPVANRSSLLGATNDALRLNCAREGEGGEGECG